MDTYEKKYNEAMLRADEAVQKGCLDKAIFDEIFPPEESEDERIIRAIIDALYSHTNSINLLSSRGYQMENIEAWLEKQKYDRMKPVYDNQDSFESALGKAWKDYNDSGARTVDGCEDNYVECAHAKGFREGYLFGLEKQKEQKPDIEICPHSIKSKSYSITGYPCEWSEEDDKIRRNLMSLLVNMRGDRITEETYQKYYPWLKNLPIGWKPSEEQLNALNFAITYFIHETNYKNPAELRDLYEQLKKL